MIKKFLFILFLSFLFCNNGFSKTNEELRAEYVLSNMQQDYITCYSFYKIGAEYIRKSNGKQDIIKGVENSSNTSLRLVHETGELIGMTLKEMSYKVKNEMKKQMNQIDNDFNNAPILLNKYASQCKRLIENKKQRILFWEKKSIDKFNE